MQPYEVEILDILELNHYSFQDVKKFVLDIKELYPEKTVEEITKDLRDKCLKDMLSNRIVDTLAIAQELEMEEDIVIEQKKQEKT